MKAKRDDIEDICNEFGIEPDFVEFVWAILTNIDLAGIVGKGGGIKRSELPPLGNFKPRTKRECALACAVALERLRQ